MKGYKISINGYCSGSKYEVGETYILKGKLEMCSNGFHFCKNIDDVFKWYHYDKNNTIIFEVEALGRIITDNDKCVTNKIKILRIVPLKEYNKLFRNYKFDKNGNLIFKKDSDGFQRKWKYDKNNNLIYYKKYSDGFQRKWKYDKNNNLIYYKNSNGDWTKWKYDKNNNLIYKKDSNGYIKKY